MSVVHILDTLTDWARTSICEQIRLKVPPLNEEANDAGYDYKLVNPAAFAMYVPTTERLPPNVHSPMPSLCVRFVKGQDNPSAGMGSINVQFCFSTWDTGTHGADILKPDGFNSFKQWSGAEAEAYFKRNGEGWRDAWNFLDIALREVESVTNIGGYVIDKNSPIEFGPLTEQEAIPDLYPFWFAWMSFFVNYPLRRNIEGAQKYL